VVDFRRAFAAIRKDPHWKRRVALGVPITLIPYVGMVWMQGWQMEYQRSVAWGNDERLPRWSFSSQALLGLKGFVAILPYSLILSLVLLPAVFVPIVLGAVAADSSASAPEVGIVFGFILPFVLVMSFTLLIIPLMNSAILRVALYGTFESGFQFKEILRLMREHKSELKRAWGFSAINVGISLAAMVAYFGLLALVAVLIPGPMRQSAGLIASLVFAGYFVYIPLGMALSLYLGMANAHFFGSYGRSAYGLEAPQESDGAPA